MPRPADPNAHSALVAAARREFVRSGVQRARVEDITDACGLSKGAFYLHFDSKEDLLRELVRQVEEGMNTLLEQRERDQAALLGAHGPVKRRDLRPGSALLAALDALETKHDGLVLELMWEWRDVVNVLLRGSHGTPFAKVIWDVIDREVERVVGITEQLKAFGLCRKEIPSRVIGATIVGTWLLVVRQMAELQEKPDFEFWLRAVKELIARGMMAREPRQKSAGKPPARRRGGPRTRRSSGRAGQESHP